MKIAIVGGGICGLTAGYRLAQKGHLVSIFEKEKIPGGLAAGFKQKNWDWFLENSYHHLFYNDFQARRLLDELGLSHQLFFAKPKASLFVNHRISRFDSPVSIFRSPEFNPVEKFRIGLVTGYLKLANNWQNLEKIYAVNWLEKYYGQKVYQTVWEPLLKAKFGSEAETISMAWFWARIKKRTAKLGYLQGGFQTLIDKLVDEIKLNHGQIILNHSFHSDDTYHQSEFDRVIFTTPISTFLKIIGDKLPTDYRKQMVQLKMIGALNLILVLKEKFLTDNTYWLNINEPNFPFVAAVEHTNFIDSQYYGGNHLLYVGGYYPQNHRYFKMKKEEIFGEFLPYLQRINPKFNFSLFIIHYSLFINSYAQPVIPLNYSQIIPQIKTPLPNVYLANMQMVYPWDRGINYAIEMGEKVAVEVVKK